MFRSSLAKLSLALLITGSASQLMAFSVVPENIGRKATVVAIFAMLTRYLTREGDSKPVRYNLDELFAGQNVQDNLFYLIDDGVIGHKAKKPYAVIDAENGRLAISTPAWPKGLMGWADFYKGGVLGALAVSILVNEYLKGNLTKASVEEFLKTKITDLGLKNAALSLINA